MVKHLNIYYQDLYCDPNKIFKQIVLLHLKKFFVFPFLNHCSYLFYFFDFDYAIKHY